MTAGTSRSQTYARLHALANEMQELLQELKQAPPSPLSALLQPLDTQHSTKTNDDVHSSTTTGSISNSTCTLTDSTNIQPSGKTVSFHNDHGVCPVPSPYHSMSRHEMRLLWYQKQDYLRFGHEAHAERRRRAPLVPVTQTHSSNISNRHPAERCSTAMTTPNHAVSEESGSRPTSTQHTPSLVVGPNKIGYWV